MRILIIVCFSLLGFIPHLHSKDAIQSDYILVLNSLNFQEPRTPPLLRAIESAFVPEGITVLSEELMVPALKTEAEADEKRARILEKYTSRPRLIVVIGDPGWLFCKPLFDHEWKNVPTVVCYSQKMIPGKFSDLLAHNIGAGQSLVPATVLMDGYNATTICAPFYIEENISLMRKLMPDMEKVAFISDDRFISLMGRQTVIEAMQAQFPYLELDLLSFPEISTQQLLDTLAQYPPNTGIIYYTWFTSAENSATSYSDDRLQTFIYSLSRSPVFTLTDFKSETGEFAGGYFISLNSFGKKTVQIIRQILNGKEARDIPPQIGGIPGTYLNYKHLERYDLDQTLYPDNAVYYQTPPGFFKLYKYYLFSGLLIIVLLITVVLMRFRFYMLNQKRKESELKLYQKYQRLVKNMPVLYFQQQTLRDKNRKPSGHIITDANPAFESCFGVSADKITGRTFDDILIEYPQLRPILQDDDDASVTIHDSKGQLRYYDKLIFQDAEEDRIDIFCIDKTDSHKIWLDAEKYRRSLEMILDNLPLAIHVKNADDNMKILFWNKKSEELFGLPADAVIGNTVSQIPLDPDFKKQVSQEDARLLTTRSPFCQLTRYHTQHGDECILYRSKNAITLSDGTTWLLCSCWDITEIQTSRLELEKLNKKYQLILKAASMSTWTYDIARREFQANFTYVDTIVRHFSPQITFSYEQFFDVLYPDDRAAFRQAISDLIEQKATSFDQQFRVTNYSDRSIDWLESYAIVDEYDENGRPLSLVGSTTNISKAKSLEQDILEAKDKAENSDRLKSAFLANMSHEIRTPLNAIVGFSSILTQTDNPDERAEFLQIIESNNQLLLQLINDILDLSKIESGTIDFSLADVDINNALYEIEQSSRLKLQDNRVTISFCEQMTELILVTDRHRFKQVVSNFINNALKFTESGEITFGYRQQEENIYFYVKDTGCGIPYDKQEAIFERFTKLNSFIPGTGLGLSICKMIVERLGGTIGVDSEPDSGSCFWFTLPLHESLPEEGLPVVASEPAEPDRPNQEISEKPLILIAEDDSSNYMLFESILRSHYTIVHAWNGLEAIELFRKHNPQLILMDIKMPHMNGYDALTEIRKLSPGIPVIAVTAFAFAEDRNRIRRSGFTDYLSKPVNAHTLKEKIVSVLTAQPKTGQSSADGRIPAPVSSVTAEKKIGENDTV